MVYLRYSRERAKTLSPVRSSSSRKIAGEILEKARQHASDETVRRERHPQQVIPFHVTAKPLKTNTPTEGRKWLAEYVVQGISLIA